MRDEPLRVQADPAHDNRVWLFEPGARDHSYEVVLWDAGWGGGASVETIYLRRGGEVPVRRQGKGWAYTLRPIWRVGDPITGTVRSVLNALEAT